VTVSCQGPTISLVSASPADGYTLLVRSAGPTFISVHFIAGRDDVGVHATCKNGQPVGFVDE
jgi:hypothetical protein